MADELLNTMTRNNNNLLVARALASSVKTLLGPQFSLKCCTSDGEAVICSSTSKLLQFIEIQHPAGFVINDACQGQYKKYRTNCKTLVCMAGFWSKAAQDLQDQGVPVPVIVRLFDDALEVCEEVCRDISFPVVETLQKYIPAEKSDAVISDQDSTSSVFRSCHSFSEPEKLDKFAVINNDDDCDDDDDDDDDISWYFDGHIPVVDSYMPRNVNHTLGVYGHIAEVSSHIPGVYGHIPGIINIEAVSEFQSELTQLQNFQPEMINCRKEDDLSPGVSRSRSLCSNQEKREDVSFGVEDETLVDILRDSRGGHVAELQSVVEFRSDASLFGKDLDDEEDEFEASFLEAVSNSAKEDFQSSLFENARGTSLENCGSKTTDTSVTARAYSKLTSVSGHEGNSDLKNIEQMTSTQSEAESSIKNKDIVNSESLSSSGYKEMNRADKLLSLVSRKLENKNKEARRQVNLSEIYKGSRHFVNDSTDTLTSTTPPSGEATLTKCNYTTDILSAEEDCRRTQIGQTDLVHSLPLRKTLLVKKSETCFTSKTSVQANPNTTQSGKSVVRDSMLLKKTSLDEKRETSSPSKTGFQSIPKTGQAEKSDLPCATLLRETSPTENNSSSTVLQTEDETVLIEKNTQLLSMLGERLSHGKELEMKLAVEVIKSLFRSSGKSLLEEFEIHLNMIHTEFILGPPSSFSQTIHGLLLESTASFQTAAVTRVATETQFIVALVNGDVTPEFRHAGLNNELKIHRVIENARDFMEPVFNHEKDWHERVIKALTTHSIGILIAKGTVKDSIIDHCLSHNVMVLQNVAYPKLQLLSFATGSTLVTYLTDLREQDIGRPVTIETWELGWAPSVVRQNKKRAGVDCVETCQYVLVRDVKEENARCEDFTSPLQTVLLCSPCKDLLCDAEERFWNSIHRLKNALACGRVLTGAGAPEIACVRRLNELAGEQSKAKVPVHPLAGWLQESLESFRPVVYKAFAQGFKEFFGSVLLNSGKFTSPHGISTHIEQLINTGLSLNFLGSFHKGISENNCNGLDIISEITRDHARTHDPNFTTRDPAQDLTSSLDDHLGSGSLSREAGNLDLAWDDYTAKEEAWRRAVGIVRILLQADMLVETGLEQGTKGVDLF